jgi:integrase
MATAAIKSEVEQWREWKRKHPDFPLTVAPCGSWCKKVRGRTHYFGPLRDPKAAREAWLEEKDYLLAGMEPPAIAAGTTVEELFDMFLKDCRERVEQGEMSKQTVTGYARLRNIFRSAGVARTVAKNMGPLQFAAISRAIADGRKPRSQLNCYVDIRSLFRWAAEMEYIEPVRFGPRFKPPSRDDIEADQESRSRFIPQDVILDVLARADQRLKVAILLGLNCAFGPGDSIAITLDNLHLDAEVPYHDFRRTKNNRRRAAALWPETVNAIRRYIDGDRRPKAADEKTLILGRGNPYGEHGCKAISRQFNRLIAVVGAKKEGASLGSLRHTYATVVDQHVDQPMIDLTMGHAGQGLRRRVYRQLHLDELKRLQSIAQVAHDWLFVPSVNVS